MSRGLRRTFPTDSIARNSPKRWMQSSTSHNQNPIQIIGLSLGIYGVTVEGANGCKVYDEIQVNTTICSLPNVITPNDDFANDNLDLSEFDVNRIEIYSRWGRLVYEKNNYINEWKGQNNNGGRLPDSTYYYIIQLKNGTDKHGWLFLTQ